MKALRVMLVDPSLFTAPYDSALTDGLLANGIDPTWMTRPTRRGDAPELPPDRTDAFFYRRVDEATRLPGRLRQLAKGLAHAWGLVQLLRKVWRQQPDVVHFQWAVVPALDVLAMLLIRRRAALVLTVHDTVPFNGERLSFWQNAGFDLPMRLAHRIIVHTDSGRRTLLARGVPPGRIAVVPHGGLRLKVPLPARPAVPDGGRYRILLFGEIKPYKGLDVLVEALGQLAPGELAAAQVVVAGRPRMDLAPVIARIGALGLGDTIRLDARRQSDAEMAALFADADCFVFPYRQIDASGVWFLTKSLGKWLIASRVGVFEADLRDPGQGELVTPGDVAALALALRRALRERPAGVPRAAGDEWAAIGARTRQVYEAALRAPAAAGHWEVQP